MDTATKSNSAEQAHIPIGKYKNMKVTYHYDYNRLEFNDGKHFAIFYIRPKYADLEFNTFTEEVNVKRFREWISHNRQKVNKYRNKEFV